MSLLSKWNPSSGLSNGSRILSQRSHKRLERSTALEPSERPELRLDVER